MVSRPATESGRFFNTSPSWSADGKLIAISAVDVGKESLSQILIYKPDGTLANSFAYPMFADYLAWMPDGSGLFVAGGSPATHCRDQLKYQPYPSGALQNMTNDLNNYFRVSVTADGKALVAVERQDFSSVFVGDVPAKLPSEITPNPSPITPGQADGQYLSWTAGGELLTVDGGFRAFLMSAEGQSRMPLLEHEVFVLSPAGCGGDTIAASLLRENRAVLHKYNTATRELKKLTDGPDDEGPSCTPDGKWVFYLHFTAAPQLMRISAEGGTPTELASNLATYARLSPDGKQVAYVQTVGQGNNQQLQFVVQSIEGGAPLKVLPATAAVDDLVWAPDGQGLVFIGESGVGSNLFYQSLSGKAPAQLTHFDTEPMAVTAVAFSPDGKKVAVTRARANNSDLVMFSNFR